jgi:hypothetical protein
VESFFKDNWKEITMRVIKFAQWNSINDFIAGLPANIEDSYEYSGPIAKLDRWGQGAAKDAETTAKNTAAGLGQEAGSESAALNPFFHQEMTAQHGFDPTQTNELLTAAGAGTGGATSALTGQAELEAARTRNPSGFTKSLDEVARDKQKALAGSSEAIAAQDVLGAKQLNQEGAAGMSGLYGENLKGQLGAMGQQAGDINAEVNASKTGWYQNLLAGIQTGADAYSKIFGGGGKG